jgi:hypothetical protein
MGRSTAAAGLARIVAAVGLSTVLAGCGSVGVRLGPLGGAGTCASPSGFSLSLASDTGGQPTPVAAALWFVAHGGVASLPGGEWTVTDRTGRTATVSSGSWTLTVARGSDGTWQVVSGTCD